MSSRQEVEKTCRREAAGVEFLLSYRVMMALRGKKPREVPNSKRLEHTLNLEAG
jgi:hypothetical protein